MADDKQQGFQKTGSSESLGIIDIPPPPPEPGPQPEPPQDDK